MKKRLLTAFITLGLISSTVAGCEMPRKNESQTSNDDKHTLHIAAAASLTDVTKALEKAFEKQHKGVNIEFNYGGSGSLRQQIKNGAPVDVFMSANTKDIDALKGKANNKFIYAQNKLVLIGQKDTRYKSVKSLKQEDKLAIGEPKSVPAGKYAQQYLTNHHLYKQVQPKLVFAKDVRQVLNYVEKGNAQLGYVYQTDYYQSKRNNSNQVKVIDHLSLKQPIKYEGATVSDKKMGKQWMQFLKSKQAKKILKKYHFEV
ncbi:MULTISPECIES: molybdate ABC transporter substrate-binding protein [Staphylococcus]|uniref:Molybdate ABC transporter substrate-binding protein n=1 Tax=Staphylococcus hsinchuensis TaxID=3051183 RepID=A0ABZ3EE50_9STAP|nr:MULTISPECIES: molybdate ABC transporter substrate-binding protein [unclassified Staphylococcus]